MIVKFSGVPGEWKHELYQFLRGNDIPFIVSELFPRFRFTANCSEIEMIVIRLKFPETAIDEKEER